MPWCVTGRVSMRRGVRAHDEVGGCVARLDVLGRAS